MLLNDKDCSDDAFEVSLIGRHRRHLALDEIQRWENCYTEESKTHVASLGLGENAFFMELLRSVDVKLGLQLSGCRHDF